MSQSFKLYRLQQMDSQLDRIRTRLQEIDTILNDNTNIQAAEEQVQNAEAALEGSKKTLHKAEELVKSQNLKIEQTEATLYGGKVHNPKELQDLQHETDALKRYLTVLDDRLLEAMILQDEMLSTYQTAVASLERVRFDNQALHSKVKEEQRLLLHEKDLLESERGAAARSIEAKDLLVYEQLRKQRRGVAVSAVADRNCSACGTTLSAAQLHSARSPNQLTRCESCGRILYGG